MKVTLAYIILFTGLNLSLGQQTIPDFRLKNVNNQWQKFSEVKGEKLTIIDFWATWCSPCIKSIPKLNELYQKYNDRGVQVIGLNIDSPRNDAKIKPFISAHKIKYPVLKDPDGTITSRLNINNIPTLLITNRQREIVFRHQGYRPGDEGIIEGEILKLLKENSNE